MKSTMTANRFPSPAPAPLAGQSMQGFTQQLMSLATLFLVVACICVLPGCEQETAKRNPAEDAPHPALKLPRGKRLIYIPTYNYALSGKQSKIPLTTTLTIHNVSRHREITIQSVEYFDAPGRRVRTYLEEKQKLSPLKTLEYEIEGSVEQNGSGANVIVTYDAPTGTTPPLVEALMVGSSETGWLSFTSRGVEVNTDKMTGPPPAPLDI